MKLGPAYQDGGKWYRPIEFSDGDVVPKGAECFVDSTQQWRNSSHVGVCPTRAVFYRLPLEHWPEVKVGDWFVCDRRWDDDEFGILHCPSRATVGVPMLCQGVCVDHDQLLNGNPLSNYYYPRQLCLKVDPEPKCESSAESVLTESSKHPANTTGSTNQSGLTVPHAKDSGTPKLMAWVPRVEKWHPPRKLLYRKVVEKGEAIQESDEWGDGRRCGIGNIGSIKASSQSFICRPVYADPEPVTLENLPDGRVIRKGAIHRWKVRGVWYVSNTNGLVSKIVSEGSPTEFTVTDYVMELKGAE